MTAQAREAGTGAFCFVGRTHPEKRGVITGTDDFLRIIIRSAFD